MGIKKTRNRILPRNIRRKKQDREMVQKTKRKNKEILQQHKHKPLKKGEEISKSIAILHNITTQTRVLEEVILT